MKSDAHRYYIGELDVDILSAPPHHRHFAESLARRLSSRFRVFSGEYSEGAMQNSQYNLHLWGGVSLHMPANSIPSHGNKCNGEPLEHGNNRHVHNRGGFVRWRDI